MELENLSKNAQRKMLQKELIRTESAEPIQDLESLSIQFF